MSAMKKFAAITGLHPFSLNRSSCAILTYAAVLVIAMLINAYLFCGFNNSFFQYQYLAILVVISNCFMPLLGLAITATPKTTAGYCCQIFASVLIFYWQACNVFVIGFIGCQFFLAMYDRRDYDPFGVCGSRTNEIVRAQFSNATATFDIVQRIDLIYKSAVFLGWWLLAPFAFAAWLLFLISVSDPKNAESGNSGNDVGETIIWMAECEEGKTEQSSADAEDGSINVDDESAPDDAAQEAEDRKSEVSSVDGRMENLCNEINEPCSNAELQSKEAKEPTFSIVDEEEETTTTKATIEDSK